MYQRTTSAEGICGLILAILIVLGVEARGQILIDDFNDGNADGWSTIDNTQNQPYGPGTFDASSGAYHLESPGLIPVGTGGTRWGIWNASSDAIYSNGFLRGTIRAGELSNTSLSMRVSTDFSTFLNGYSFVGAPNYEFDSFDWGRFGISRLSDNEETRWKLLDGDIRFDPDEDWNVEAGAVGDEITMKVWRVGEPEPASPQLAIRDTTHDGGQFGVQVNIDNYAAGKQEERTGIAANRLSATYDDIYFTPPDPGTVALRAANNATIHPGGPRQGSDGKDDLYIEGVNNGSFASYGVARWDLATAVEDLDNAFGADNWMVEKVELRLSQVSRDFTAAGDVEVLYTADDATDFDPGSSSLTYPLDAEFADRQSILEYTFTGGKNGRVETHLLYDASNPANPGSMAVADEVALGDTLTLLLSDADPAVAATYAGFSNPLYPGPSLRITAAPILSADFDKSGEVDGADLVVWQSNFGASNQFVTIDDGNTDSDTDVDGFDFLSWQRQLGGSLASSQTVNVPEPASLVLLSLAFPFLLSQRKRLH